MRHKLRSRFYPLNQAIDLFMTERFLTTVFIFHMVFLYKVEVVKFFNLYI